MRIKAKHNSSIPSINNHLFRAPNPRAAVPIVTNEVIKYIPEMSEES